MPAICRAFGKTPQEILGCIPKVYWLIHRAMDPETRQRMRFAAVAAGLPIDVEQEYRENGWAKPTQPHRAIPGEGVIVSDGADAVGSLRAAGGVENPKDPSPAKEAALRKFLASDVDPYDPKFLCVMTEFQREHFGAQGPRVVARGAMSQMGAATALSALGSIYQANATRIAALTAAHKDATR
jgi:hypothetical protein